VEDIAQYPLVVPKVGHTRDAIEDLFHLHKLKPRYAMELDSSELLKRFVAADIGVGFIASSNVLEDVQAKVLCAVPLAETTSAATLRWCSAKTRLSARRACVHRYCGEK
jgi:DNA-binding transcriptional LysR family regulator